MRECPAPSAVKLADARGLSTGGVYETRIPLMHNASVFHAGRLLGKASREKKMNMDTHGYFCGNDWALGGARTADAPETSRVL